MTTRGVDAMQSGLAGEGGTFECYRPPLYLGIFWDISFFRDVSNGTKVLIPGATMVPGRL